MVAAVETMAYAGEVPWHGLGTKVPHDLSTDEMLKIAKKIMPKSDLKFS